MNTASYDWLIAARSERDFRWNNEILNATSIRFDQTILTAFPFKNVPINFSSLGLCDGNFIYKFNKVTDNKTSNRRYSRREYHDRYFYKKSCRYGDQSCAKINFEWNYYRSTERFKNLTKNMTYKSFGNILPLFRSGIMSYNYSRTFDMVNITKFGLRQQFNQWNRVNHYNMLEGSYVVQYFKVRSNSTLYAYFLGK